MKKLLLVFAVAGIALGFSSCKDECCDCDGISGFSSEICKDDGNFAGGWDDVKKTYEAAGCDCD